MTRIVLAGCLSLLVTAPVSGQSTPITIRVATVIDGKGGVIRERPWSSKVAHRANRAASDKARSRTTSARSPSCRV